MQYIILDLEWNQPLSYQSHVYKEVGDKLIFEMIQIGAVKLNDRYEVVDSVSIPIRPVHYVKIHPRIRRMTQLGPEELADAPEFLEAMDQFAAWCGEDYALLTWGCDDVSVLKQNMDFFACEVALPPLCDIQRMYSDEYKCRDRKGLKAAMEQLDIQPDEDKSFHNALHDAYYTALVFAKMPHPERVLEYPQQPRQLIHTDHGRDREKVGDVCATMRAGMDSDQAQHPRCPRCGKPTTLEEGGYVKQCAGKYVGLSTCKDHGTVLCNLRFKPIDDGQRSMTLRTSFATAANRAYVHTKRIQMANKQNAWLAAHDAPLDEEQELLETESTSMPFEE